MSHRLLLPLVGIAAAAWLVAAPSRAQVTTVEGASVQFFPLVAADAGRDTLIQLANGSPQRIFVRCVYTPGGLGGQNAAVDFHLVLDKFQPTHWLASTGREVNPDDEPCDREMPACDGAGLDPGRIPPLPEDFAGDLICIQVDRSDAPVSGNALRGVATLVDTASGDIAKYPSVGLRGAPVNDADETLCLGGEASAECPRGAEYAGCPLSWSLLHRAEGGAPDRLQAHTKLVIATCSRRAGTGAGVAQILIFNEFEQRLSTSFSVQRWTEVALADNPIFDRDVHGSDFLQTRLRPSAASPGFVVIGFTSLASSDGAETGGSAGAVPHMQGVAPGDRIVLADE